MKPASLLEGVIAAVEGEGEALAAEARRPGGPRGRRGSAPVDTEIELRLREKLQRLLPCAFTGEETGASAGEVEGWLWLVDPHDGTFEFMNGRGGSSVSVALLKGRRPVLGAVHAPLSPDRGRDTIAWAEGGPIVRNGAALSVDLSGRRLAEGEAVWASASAGKRAEAWSRLIAPAHVVAMPSIAYRLARVAAGDGVAAVSIHGVAEYDVAAGLALVSAAGGTMLDAEGREVALSGEPGARLSGCFAGAPEAARRLAALDWSALRGA